MKPIDIIIPYLIKNDRLIRVLYTRVSTLEQKTDRQTVNSSLYDLVVEDKCSGSILFFKREGGKKIKTFIDMGCKLELDVHAIDRIGRDLRDVLNIIHYFSTKGIPFVLFLRD
jgi:DNA invertase Pin-like site-specific DNA recombinase